ncbi:unnamed protein product [Clonostachys solani]|uniref:Uncharacterized protein n=1 Tax=Clonostachys solani TaxID=160281 RepID=A0A9N9W5E8_9HYPO|nr:unnamed protein product [Clonostachys solani]
MDEELLLADSQPQAFVTSIRRRIASTNSRVRKRHRHRSPFNINLPLLLLHRRRRIPRQPAGPASSSRMATYTYYECLLHEPGQAIIFVDHGGGQGSVLHVHMDGSSLHYSAPRRAYAAIEEHVRDRRAVGTVPAEGGDERVREVAGRLALPRRGGVEEWLGEVRGQLVEENVLSASGGGCAGV